MSKRFFTSDFHLGDSMLLDPLFMKNKQRPFESIENMNNTLIYNCNKYAVLYKDENGFIIDKDTIIHLGDFACYKNNKGFEGLNEKPQEIVQKINANFINIRGNHDYNNRVKSQFNSVQLNLGKRYPQVTAGHYPSYDARSFSYIQYGWINLCGHVHGAWKHCLDLDHKILNINMSVDVWNFNIVSEEALIKYIDFLLRKKPDDLYKCKIINNKLIFNNENKQFSNKII